MQPSPLTAAPPRDQKSSRCDVLGSVGISSREGERQHGVEVLTEYAIKLLAVAFHPGPLSRLSRSKWPAQALNYSRPPSTRQSQEASRWLVTIYRLMRVTIRIVTLTSGGRGGARAVPKAAEHLEVVS